MIKKIIFLLILTIFIINSRVMAQNANKDSLTLGNQGLENSEVKKGKLKLLKDYFFNSPLDGKHISTLRVFVSWWLSISYNKKRPRKLLSHGLL